MPTCRTLPTGVAGLVGRLRCARRRWSGANSVRLAAEEQLRVPAARARRRRRPAGTLTVSLMNAICSAVNGVPLRAASSAIAFRIAATAGQVREVRWRAAAERRRGGASAAMTCCALGGEGRPAREELRVRIDQRVGELAADAGGVALLRVEDRVVAQLGPRRELRVQQSAAPGFGRRDREAGRSDRRADAATARAATPARRCRGSRPRRRRRARRPARASTPAPARSWNLSRSAAAATPPGCCRTPRTRRPADPAACAFAPSTCGGTRS